MVFPRGSPRITSQDLKILSKDSFYIDTCSPSAVTCENSYEGRNLRFPGTFQTFAVLYATHGSEDDFPGQNCHYFHVFHHSNANEVVDLIFSQRSNANVSKEFCGYILNVTVVQHNVLKVVIFR